MESKNIHYVCLFQNYLIQGIENRDIGLSRLNTISNNL